MGMLQKITQHATASAGNFSTFVPDAAAVIALVRTPDGNDFDIGRLAQNLVLAAAAAVPLAACAQPAFDPAKPVVLPEAKLEYSDAHNP